MEMKDNETLGLKTIIVNYLLHWKLFVIVFLISIVPAVLYLILYPRTYEMMARIQIQEDKEMTGSSFGLGEAAGLMKSIGLGSVSSGAINIDDELNTLTSNALLKKMVLDLGLNVEYTRPYSFIRLYDNVPFVLSADSITNERLEESVEFKVNYQSGNIKIKTESDLLGKKNFDFTSLPAVISLPYGDFVLALAPGFESIASQKMDIVFNPAGSVAEGLAEDILIEEVSKTSTMIELLVTDYEKRRGVEMLNTLIDKYNEDTYDYKKSEAEKTMDFLNMRIDSMTSLLRSVEGDIAIYKNANRLTDIQSDVLFYVEQMKELQVKLIEVESQSHVLSLMNDFINDPANKYNLVPVLLSQEGEKGGGAIMAYNEILLERARIIQNSDMNNPLVTTLTEKANRSRGSVFATISNSQKALQLTIEDIKAKEKALYDKMSSFPDQEKEFIELKRQQEVLQGVYLILLQKREETALNSGLDRKKARIVDAAYVKSRPIGPRKLYAAIGMILFTLIVPVAYLFCKEQYLSLKDAYLQAKK